MRQVVLGLGIALLAGALASACGGSSCVEGMSVACACPGGGSGAQLCHGGQYGECVCGVSGDDGGLGGDGGVPASDGSMPGRDGSTPGPDGSTADGGTSDGGAPGCTGGATRCGASGVERCESGAWVADTSCAIGCMDGACADAPAMCTPGATRCFRTSVQRCNRDGTAWLFDSVCADGCADGLCTGACTAGADRCNGDQRETCASDGASWSASETCDMGCESSVCVEAELTLNGTVMDLSGTHVYAGCVDVDLGGELHVPDGETLENPRPMLAGQRQREHHHRRRRHAALPRERERRRRGHGDGWRRSVPRVARHAAALGQRELDAHDPAGRQSRHRDRREHGRHHARRGALRQRIREHGHARRNRVGHAADAHRVAHLPERRLLEPLGRRRRDHLGSALRLGPRLLRQRRRHHAEPGRRHLPLDRVDRAAGVELRPRRQRRARRLGQRRLGGRHLRRAARHPPQRARAGRHVEQPPRRDGVGRTERRVPRVDRSERRAGVHVHRLLLRVGSPGRHRARRGERHLRRPAHALALGPARRSLVLPHRRRRPPRADFLAHGGALPGAHRRRSRRRQRRGHDHRRGERHAHRRGDRAGERRLGARAQRSDRRLHVPRQLAGGLGALSHRRRGPRLRRDGGVRHGDVGQRERAGFRARGQHRAAGPRGAPRLGGAARSGRCELPRPRGGPRRQAGLVARRAHGERRGGRDCPLDRRDRAQRDHLARVLPRRGAHGGRLERLALLRDGLLRVPRQRRVRDRLRVELRADADLGFLGRGGRRLAPVAPTAVRPAPPRPPGTARATARSS